MTARTTQQLGRAVGGGALAGMFGAAALLAATVGTAVLGGVDAWLVAKSGAAPLFGARATIPGLDVFPVMVGLVVRLVAGAAWGAAFGALALGARRKTVLGLGVAWGVLAWLLVHYALLPLVGAADVAGRWPVPFAFGQYVVFGLATGLAFLPFARREPATAVVRDARWRRLFDARELRFGRMRGLA